MKMQRANCGCGCGAWFYRPVRVGRRLMYMPGHYQVTKNRAQREYRDLLRQMGLNSKKEPFRRQPRLPAPKIGTASPTKKKPGTDLGIGPGLLAHTPLVAAQSNRYSSGIGMGPGKSRAVKE